MSIGIKILLLFVLVSGIIWYSGMCIQYNTPELSIEEDKDYITDYDASQMGLQVQPKRKFYYLTTYKEVIWREGFLIKKQRDTLSRQIYHIDKIE